MSASEPLDYHVASRASNLSYRLETAVRDAIDDGFSVDDLRRWFDEALETFEDQS